MDDDSGLRLGRVACVIRPRRSKWIPTHADRKFAQDRVARWGPEHFETYAEYFFSIHLDPYLRFWHSIGMIVGLIMFSWLISNWIFFHAGWKEDLVLYLLGVLHFYGFGIISHYIYDGGAAKTELGHFWDTTWEVVRFNTLTMTGKYQAELERFLKKYPFLIEAYDLIQIENFVKSPKGNDKT